MDSKSRLPKYQSCTYLTWPWSVSPKVPFPIPDGFEDLRTLV
jgi:hypothetical protein